MALERSSVPIPKHSKCRIRHDLARCRVLARQVINASPIRTVDPDSIAENMAGERQIRAGRRPPICMHEVGSEETYSHSRLSCVCEAIYMEGG